MQLEETPDEILEAEPPRDEEPTHSLPYVLGHLCREITGRGLNSVQFSRMEQYPKHTLGFLMGQYERHRGKDPVLDRTVTRIFSHVDLQEFEGLGIMSQSQRVEFYMGYKHPLDKLVQA